MKIVSILAFLLLPYTAVYAVGSDLLADSARANPAQFCEQTEELIGLGDIAQAKQRLFILNDLLPVADEPELTICVPHDLGVIYRREGQNDSALYYYDRALAEAIAQGDVEWQGAICVNVGVLHYNLKHYEETESYLQKALHHLRQTDDEYSLLSALQILAAAQLTMHKEDEAEPNIREAWRLAVRAESPEWQLRCLTSMLHLFDAKQQTDSAQAYVARGDAILQQVPQQGIAAVGYLVARANHYYMTGQWGQALADYETTTATGMGTGEAAVLERMAQCNAHLGHYEQAFALMDSARVRSDSMASERMTAQLADFNVKYQTLEKDLEIARLQTQQLWYTIIIVAIVLLFVVGWLFYRQHRQRREAQMRINTLEDERRRIARELHDGLCNDMLALEMQMQFAPAGASGQSNVQTAVAEDVQTSATEYKVFQSQLRVLRQRARELSHQLMPPEFDHLSLTQLLQLYADALDRATAVTVHHDLCVIDSALSPQTSHELYRIVQEQTANIVKGGTATIIDILLEQTAAGRFRLTISDDGTPATDDNSMEQGLGHRTLRDRVTAIGGRSRTSRTDDGKNNFLLEFSV